MSTLCQTTIAIIINLIVVFIVGAVSAVNVNDFKEGSCISPPTDTRFSLNSIVSKDWYIVLWSKYDVYRKTAALLDIPEDQLTEYNNVDRSCQSIKLFEHSGSVVSGFLGKRKLLQDYSLTKDGVLEWILRKPDGRLGAKLTSYVTYISFDNSFFVTVQCWDDTKQKSFTVFSSQKKLDSSITTLIKDHLQSLGFDLKFVYEMQQESCMELSEPENERNEETPVFNPISGFINIIQTKIDFVSSLITTLFRLLTAPFQFLNQTLGSFRLRL